jgi:hypothetical protein
MWKMVTLTFSETEAWGGAVEAMAMVTAMVAAHHLRPPLSPPVANGVKVRYYADDIVLGQKTL